MAIDVGVAISIAKGVWEYFAGGKIAIKSDYISTSESKCDDNVCPWQPKAVRILTLEQRVFALGWVRSRLELVVKFQYNGCDVNNVRITLGKRSFIGFGSGASYEVTATGGTSKLTSSSGCQDCCRKSSCVEFDLVVYSSGALTIGGGTKPYTVKICGNGSVKIT